MALLPHLGSPRQHTHTLHGLAAGLPLYLASLSGERRPTPTEAQQQLPHGRATTAPVRSSSVRQPSTTHLSSQLQQQRQQWPIQQQPRPLLHPPTTSSDDPLTSPAARTNPPPLRRCPRDPPRPPASSAVAGPEPSAPLREFPFLFLHLSVFMHGWYLIMWILIR